MNKSSIDSIDVQLWDVVPSFEEIPPAAKLEYQSLIDAGNFLG